MCECAPEMGFCSFRCVLSRFKHSLSKNSKADRISPSMLLLSWNVFSSCSKVSQPGGGRQKKNLPNWTTQKIFPWHQTQGEKLPKKTTLTDLGFCGQRMDTAVITPKVPSDPMNSCLRSYPVLSFRSVDKQSSTCPLASTCTHERPTLLH